MKAKQKSIRVFDIEIESQDEFFSYMDKNLILLKEYLLVINGEITEEITEYLKENEICFIKANDCKLNMTSKVKSGYSRDIISKNFHQKTEKIDLVTINSQSSGTIINSNSIKTLLLERTIRSGEEIIHDGDITIFGRVNSAAKVISDGNVEIYGTIDGVIECNGEYMIVKELDKGHIIFNGSILDKERFDGGIKRVTYSSDGAVIKDLFETVNN